MKHAKILLLAIGVLSLTMITGCVPGDGAATEGNPAGFLSGIWHGWIAPVSLVWGFFDASVRVYEKMNTGWWYDFGFYISIIAGFGSLSLVRRKKPEHKSKKSC